MRLEFIHRISQRFPHTLFYVSNGEITIKTTPNSLLPFLSFLKSHTETRYSQLTDLTARDQPERKLRFEMIYLLLSFRNVNAAASSDAAPQRIYVSVSIAEGTSLPSVVSIYPSAGWYEREVWDRFGVFFRNHPDFRRRLTDYGFKGHPLRKDFPLTGFVEVRYDDLRKRILYEGVSLPQEYRIFTLESPWLDNRISI